MDYDDFCDEWRQAMRKARLMPAQILPTETLDLKSGDRSYQVYLHDPGGVERSRLFYTTLELSWRWDALLTARFATTEEDLLTELLGMERRPVDTQRPLLRVDAVLHASTSPEGYFPLPHGSAWRQWASELASGVAPYFLVDPDDEDDDDEVFPVIYSWAGEPEAALHCSPSGQLYLRSVNLPAFRLVRLPRQWDDPNRPREAEPLAELEAFLGGAQKAWNAWIEALKLLSVN